MDTEDYDKDTVLMMRIRIRILMMMIRILMMVMIRILMMMTMTIQELAQFTWLAPGAISPIVENCVAQAGLFLKCSDR